MPSCSCDACAGKTISKKLFNTAAHVEGRRKAALRDNYESSLASTNALLDQFDRATEQYVVAEASAQHLSAQAVADNLSGFHRAPGGRLWSSHVPGTTDPTLPPKIPVQHNKPSPADEKTILEQLRTMESQLFHIVQVIDALPPNTTPSYRNEPFPIQENVDLVNGIWNTLQRMPRVDESKTVKKAREAVMAHAARALENLKPKSQAWHRAVSLLPSDDSDQVYDTSHRFKPLLQGYQPAIQLAMLLVIALQILNHNSRRAGTFTLAMLSLMLKTVFGWPTVPLSAANERLIKELPETPETIQNKFSIETKHEIYAVCPNASCHHLYPPTFRPGSKVPEYPRKCNAQQLSGSICNTALTSAQSVGILTYHKPIKRFVAFDMRDWISGLLAREGCEESMDGAWNRPKTTTMTDIFDGEYLKEFKRNGKPFSQVTGTDAHYTLSMSLDFFNPRHNKDSGSPASCGVVSFVLLNLPPAERYKAENIFLAGIIPGPKEPPLTAMNSYLQPFTALLEEFWTTGVHFSKSAKYEFGRRVILALIILICDLPAARKTSGTGSVKHNHLCSVCHCTRKEHGYGNTDCDTWRLRTDAEFRKDSLAYLTAPTEKLQKEIFSSTGVRWSSLTRLQYFDMRKCVAVDAMHNLFLGLLHEHSNLLGIGIDRPRQVESVIDLSFAAPPTFVVKDAKNLAKLQRYLQTSLLAAIREDSASVLKRLSDYRLQPLRFLVSALDLDPSRFVKGKDNRPKKHGDLTREEAASLLLIWRKDQEEIQTTEETTSTEMFRVLSSSELSVLQHTIKTLITPTWLVSLPSSLGEATKVKLKADQWRVFGTVYLPLFLLCIWGTSNFAERSERADRCKSILDTTLTLISAVMVATSSTVTNSMILEYRAFMVKYMEGIKTLFPDYQFKPNHHMSLHLYEYLRYFGPVHSWWTFPFERMIGSIQRIPTNNILGQMEATMALIFHRSANLRNIFRSVVRPAVFAHAEQLFKNIFSARYDIVAVGGILQSARLFGSPSGSNVNAAEVEQGEMDVGFDVGDEDGDMALNSDESPAVTSPDNSPKERLELYQRLLQPAVSSGRKVEIRNFRTYKSLMKDGLRYSACRQHQGNSLVVFSGKDASEHSWGQIEHFLKVEGEPTEFMALRTFEVYDKDAPFSSYPYIHAKYLRPLPPSMSTDDIRVYPVNRIIAHFAALPMKIQNDDVLASLSLSRNVCP
ncbi:hypothetical protein CVT24_012284 [Panaeolus cyanescens]|uniref:DUF4218 domain-containing protein n=1 Tax=Panaeolus cyanescens TaxID=181874 RepID=A0A409WK20_9AGAR|nr:hypothetical protein CVT24_012284 [Panaeolus cyanescens]